MFLSGCSCFISKAHVATTAVYGCAEAAGALCVLHAAACSRTGTVCPLESSDTSAICSPLFDGRTVKMHERDLTGVFVCVSRGVRVVLKFEFWDFNVKMIPCSEQQQHLQGEV